ncbi:MAG: DUF4174 domain-containing protein [Roseibacillus sp.]
MKNLLLLTLGLLFPLSASPLKDYRWKNRILLIHSSAPLEDLSKHKAELTERHLIILNLSASKTKLPNEVLLTDKQRKKLRDFYKVPETQKETFILIGKDGSEKARQEENLNLAKFFALIDTMPMRKAEIKRNARL